MADAVHPLAQRLLDGFAKALAEMAHDEPSEADVQVARTHVAYTMVEGILVKTVPVDLSEDDADKVIDKLVYDVEETFSSFVSVWGVLSQPIQRRRYGIPLSP